jgi:hypothetical protein
MMQPKIVLEHIMTMSAEGRREILDKLRTAVGDLQTIEEENGGVHDDLKPVIEQLLTVIRKLESSH